MRLAALFGLDLFGCDVVAWCAGYELDPRYRDSAGPPTVGRALERLSAPSWRALHPTSPLRRWGLVDIDTDAPFVGARLRLAGDVLDFLLGLPPGGRPGRLLVAAGAPVAPPPSSRDLATSIVSTLARYGSPSPPGDSAGGWPAGMGPTPPPAPSRPRSRGARLPPGGRPARRDPGRAPAGRPAVRRGPRSRPGPARPARRDGRGGGPRPDADRLEPPGPVGGLGPPRGGRRRDSGDDARPECPARRRPCAGRCRWWTAPCSSRPLARCRSTRPVAWSAVRCRAPIRRSGSPSGGPASARRRLPPLSRRRPAPLSRRRLPRPPPPPRRRRPARGRAADLAGRGGLPVPARQPDHRGGERRRREPGGRRPGPPGRGGRAGCRRLARTQLDGVADRVVDDGEVDVVLPPLQREQLVELETTSG